MYLYLTNDTAIVNCVANNNGGDGEGAGIQLWKSSDDTLISNTATGNGIFGIGLFGSGSDSGSNGNILRSNQTDGNGRTGIVLDSFSSQNLMQANKAHNNGGFDLADNNPACDANTWKSNSFTTANQPCIH